MLNIIANAVTYYFNVNQFQLIIKIIFSLLMQRVFSSMHQLVMDIIFYRPYLVSAPHTYNHKLAP